MNKKKVTDPPAKMRRITIRLTLEMYEVICSDAKAARLPIVVSAKYCYATHELRLHQNDRCKRFTLV